MGMALHQARGWSGSLTVLLDSPQLVYGAKCQGASHDFHFPDQGTASLFPDPTQGAGSLLVLPDPTQGAVSILFLPDATQGSLPRDAS